MKIVAIEEPDPDLPVAPEADRPGGVHVSSIIKLMLIEQDAKKYGSDSPIDADTIERGYVWEEVLSDALVRRNHGQHGYRPEPILHEGVWMSPDWINPDAEYPLEEWKATRVSKKRDIQDAHWYWFLQILCYLKGTGYRKAVLRVWYINDDYSKPAMIDPRVRQSYVKYTLQYSNRDVDEGWRKLIGFARNKGMFDETPDWATTGKDDSWENTTAKRKSLMQPSQPKRTAGTTNPRNGAPSSRQRMSLVTGTTSRNSRNRKS